MNGDSLDKKIYAIPVFGKTFVRTYGFFRKHTAITNLMHVILGLGIGFIFVGGYLFWPGVVAVILASLGHIYAYIKGS